MTIQRGLTPPLDAIVMAVSAARTSPCQKSKRGVVVFDGRTRRSAYGFNSQPDNRSCTGTEACRQSCGKICIHAEERAILSGLRDFGSLLGYKLVHVKVVDGELVAGGGPSCWPCSRTVLEVGLDGVFLFESPTSHDELAQWVYYSAHAFHDETIRACGLEAS